VDIYKPFLERITEWSTQEGLSRRIRTLQASMEELPFDPEAFDLIWSEGAIDIIGLEKGLSLWKQYCKQGGYIVVSDLTLFESPAPEELIHFWKPYGVTCYTEEEKARQISRAGLQLLSMFRLEEKGWLDHFYEPMQKVIEQFRKKRGEDQECAGVLNALEQEAVMYRKFGKLYGYTFFVMQKPWG
jgi:ubiquinone/menaquinone biosynthesis C-methylase UbiE